MLSELIEWRSNMSFEIVVPWKYLVGSHLILTFSGEQAVAPSNHKRKMQVALTPPSIFSTSNELSAASYEVDGPLSPATYQKAADQHQLGGGFPEPYPPDWPRIDR